MVEEFYGKISRSGANLSDGLEDKLTGDFFGSLRYMNFHDGLQKILNLALFKSEGFQKDVPKVISIIENIKCYELQDGVNIEFWPKKTDGENRGELDVLLKFDNCFIGIEVKFRSGLSSDDQLIREAGMLCDWADGKDKILLFVAPHQSCISIDKKNYDEINKKDVILAFVSWEDILQSLKEINIGETNVGQHLIIQDLIQLLTHKGFDVFSTMIANVPYNQMGKEADYMMMYKNAAHIVFMTYKNTKGLLAAIKKELENQSDTSTRGVGYKYECMNEYSAKGITNDFWLIFSKDDTVLYAVNIFLTDTNENNPSEPILKVLKYSYNSTIKKISGEKLANAYDEHDDDNTKVEYDSIDIQGKTYYIYQKNIKEPNKYDSLQSIYYVDLPLMDVNKDNISNIVDIFDKLSTI